MFESQFRNVAEVLSLQTAKQPDKIAVRHLGKSYTYGQLQTTSHAVTKALSESGIKAGDKVAIISPNHPDFISAFFAASGLGATVVPINPLLKAYEINHILSDSEAKVLIVHESTIQEVSDGVKDVPLLKNIFVLCYAETECQKQLVLTGECQANLGVKRLDMTVSGALNQKLEPIESAHQAELDDLAVLVYTSGTTGKPKGAMLTHKNLLSAVAAAHAAFPVNSEDRLLGALPLCHIYGLTVVMLGTLIKGGSLALIDKFDVKIALSTIENERVTVLPAVPTMYQYMVLELEKKHYDLVSLRLCLAGGAPLSKSMYESLARFVKAPLVEGYGLTEVSCVATLTPVDGEIVHGSVGPAIPFVQIGIFDTAGEMIESNPDLIGEIAIKGPNVMAGYYRAPEKSKEVLKDGWFFTGDLGYLDAKGYLFIVGRAKELIIRGGQNIYPREVETVIAKIPGILDVAVLGIPEAIMGERVKAVVVVEEGASVSVEEIRQFCAEHLADYKVPRVVEFAEKLPRNSTGKILKSQLI